MKKMMALDLGEKRMGIALNRGTRLAFPWQVFSSGTVKENINTILDIVRQLDIETIVIGFPIRLNTAIKEEAQRVLRFKEELGKYFPGEIVLFDERLTTKEAEKRLLEMDLSRAKRKKVIDQVAASIVLQTYIDHLMLP